MAMTVVATGKMYNGTVYDYTHKDNDRKVFRGRLNYRDRTNGEWYWIDAVCWKDFGDNDGLVGFLDEHFNKDNGPKDTGGQPIEIVGYVRPKTAKFTAKINIKKGGKVQEVEVPNTEHETYELVIETVDFPPSTEKRSKKSDSEPVDFDAIDGDGDDDFEIVGGVDSKEKKSDPDDVKETKDSSADDTTSADDDDDFFQDN